MIGYRCARECVRVSTVRTITLKLLQVSAFRFLGNVDTLTVGAGHQPTLPIVITSTSPHHYGHHYDHSPILSTYNNQAVIRLSIRYVNRD